MRLIAEILKNSDERLEGTIQSDPSATPVPFSGVLDLPRVLEDEVPAAVESDAGSAAPS